VQCLWWRWDLLQKQCGGSDLEDKSIGMEVVERLINVLKIALVVICVMFVSACITFVSVFSQHINFMNQYEFSNTEDTQVELKADGNSSAIYQGGKGNTINGGERKSND
jgi:hypothetical protein